MRVIVQEISAKVPGMAKPNPLPKAMFFLEILMDTVGERGAARVSLKPQGDSPLLTLPGMLSEDRLISLKPVCIRAIGNKMSLAEPTIPRNADDLSRTLRSE
jgi:hypothetical protein